MGTSSTQQQHHHHRSTLTQSNKPFKSGRHASKRKLKKFTGNSKTKLKVKSNMHPGIQKVNTVVSSNPTLPSTSSLSTSQKTLAPSIHGNLNQKQRKLKIKQRRLLHSHQIKQQLGLYTGPSGIPKVVTLIPLCKDIDLNAAVTELGKSLNPEFQWKSKNGLGKGSCLMNTTFKHQRIQWVLPLHLTLPCLLHTTLVADYVIFVVSAKEEVDAFGETVLSTLAAQGISTMYCVVQHLNDGHSSMGIKKALISYMKDWFPTIQRVFSLHLVSECQHLLRTLLGSIPNGISWRDQCAYLTIDTMQFEKNQSSEPFEHTLEPEKGTLKISGYVRGNPLSPNRLMHVPGLGDFRILKIVPQSTKRVDSPLQPMLYEPDSDADDVMSMNDDVDMNSDLRNSLEPDMEIEQQQQARQKVLRVPKGTSLYQAAWLSASEDEDEDDDEAIKISQDEDVLMNKMDQLELAFPYIPKPLENENENENEMEEPEDSWETLPLSMDKTEMNDLENDLDEHAQYLASRQLVQANNIQNDHDPSKKRDDEDEVVEDEEEEKVNDEVDTSPDVPARVRYQKYRGLNSFYTSPWDPHEQLPSLYGQIYQLPSFSMTRKRVLKSQVHAPIPLGTYVDIYVADVPKTNFESCVDELLWVTTLLPFEHQVGEMHFHIQLRGDPSRLYSKRPVLIQVGSRLFQVTPLLSEPKLGPNQCTKYIRTCGHRGQCILSTLMPMALHGPILVFNLNATECLATGTLANHQQRILIKRILLTGKPYKLHRKVAMIRWMFWSPEDVLWFKKIPLLTKLGRVGHIRESVGTHGHMKCTFDLPLKQHDTIYLPLYKRVFPKLKASLVSLVSLNQSLRDVQDGMEVEEVMEVV